MNLLQTITISFVAIIHVYILIIEMFLWSKKKGIKTFGLKSKAFAEETKVMGANQGLYNGFLAFGLFYGLITNSKEISLLFLSFVFIAGLYGVYSTKIRAIFYVQSVPAIIAANTIIWYSF